MLGSAVKDAVKNLRYVEMDNGDLKLEWDPPDIDGVQKYLISVSSDWNSGEVTHETDGTSYLFTDVALCASYTFSITANAPSDYNLDSISLKTRARYSGE